MAIAKLLFASTNQGKLREAGRIAEAFGIELYGLGQVGHKDGRQPPCVLEGESSYERNAVCKAKSYATWAGVPTLSDDTGLEVAVLGGLPGVFTARFGVGRVQQLLGAHRLSEATFVCSVAYVEPSGRTIVVTKRLSGHLDMRGEIGEIVGPLPYSHVFIPHGQTRPLAELAESREYRSHRGDALAALFSALLPL